MTPPVAPASQGSAALRRAIIASGAALAALLLVRLEVRDAVEPESIDHGNAAVTTAQEEAVQIPFVRDADASGGRLWCEDGSALYHSCDEPFMTVCSRERGRFQCTESTHDRSNCLLGTCQF
jgi:hypothetical protein